MELLGDPVQRSVRVSVLFQKEAVDADILRCFLQHAERGVRRFLLRHPQQVVHARVLRLGQPRRTQAQDPAHLVKDVQKSVLDDVVRRFALCFQFVLLGLLRAGSRERVADRVGHAVRRAGGEVDRARRHMAGRPPAQIIIIISVRPAAGLLAQFAVECLLIHLCVDAGKGILDLFAERVPPHPDRTVDGVHQRGRRAVVVPAFCQRFDAPFAHGRHGAPQKLPVVLEKAVRIVEIAVELFQEPLALLPCSDPELLSQSVEFEQGLREADVPSVQMKLVLSLQIRSVLSPYVVCQVPPVRRRCVKRDAATDIFPLFNRHKSTIIDCFFVKLTA